MRIDRQSGEDQGHGEDLRAQEGGGALEYGGGKKG